MTGYYSINVTDKKASAKGPSLEAHLIKRPVALSFHHLVQLVVYDHATIHQLRFDLVQKPLMLCVSTAFLTYEGLTCNVRVTYAERMPSVLGASTKFIDFMTSNISGHFIRDLSNKPVRNSSYKLRP